MSEESSIIRPVGEDELRSVRGGSIWGKIKSAAKWVKDHVVATFNSIGYKGKF